MGDEKPMGQVIQIDEARMRDHLGEMVRGTVEETLNAMLDAYVELAVTNAVRLGRQDTRAGSYDEFCRPVPATLISGFRSCGARPLRLRSSNANAGGRAQSRKRRSRFT
jgi:hypothetical protein